MYTRRRRVYFILMGGCLFLFVSAWSFVRIWSIPAAVGLCVVALAIPPVAAMIGNSRSRDDRWWDEPKDDEAPPDRKPDDWSDDWSGDRSDERDDKHRRRRQ
jgi:hypothetical protein